MTQTAEQPSSLPGLSDTRLEETTPLQELRDALSAQVLLVSNLYPRQTTQNATAIRHGWERLDKAHADLLAEVRRLQGAIRQHEEDEASVCPAREGTAQAVREERRCCAQIADDEASKSDDIDAGYLSAQRIARKIRSRSHPDGADRAE